MNIISGISCQVVGSIYDLAFSSFPDMMQIETTNACNAKCRICPHKNMQRPVVHMDDDMYYKIIDECAENKCGNVHLHNFGEPLLDKNLAKRVYYAKNKGLKRVKIFSNGSLITAQKALDLINAGLDEIKISFDGATKEEFEKIRFPLKFDEVTKNIRELIRLRDEHKSPLKIKVTCCSTSDKSETMKMLQNGADEFSFSKIHNWSGDEPIDEKEISDKRTGIRKPCSRVWRTFTVLANGDVALCCLDYEGSVILGNVRETSISDIWHNRIYHKIRLFHKNNTQHEIRICDKCTKSFW